MHKVIDEAEFAGRMSMSVRLFRKMARESGIPAPMNPMTNYRNWVWSEAAVGQFVSGVYKGAMGAPPLVAKPETAAPAKAPTKKKRGKATTASEGTSEFILPSDFVIEPLPDGSIKISVRKKG